MGKKLIIQIFSYLLMKFSLFLFFYKMVYGVMSGRKSDNVII